MTTALNNFQNESSSLALADYKHLIRWRDQSGRGVGDPMIFPSYGTFTASWTESGTYSNGSAVITGITNTIRIQPGQQFTATGFTGTQTVVSVDSGTQITASTNATGGGGATTLTFTSQTSPDPLMRIGVNAAPGGGEIVARQGYVTTNHEGHFHADSDDSATMEWYVEFGIDGATGSHRPYFAAYDKINKVPGSSFIIAGRDKIISMSFGNYGGDGTGTAVFEFQENLFTMQRAPHQTGEDLNFRIDSNTAKNSIFDMSANGDAIGSPTVRMTAGFMGGSSQHRSFTLGMRSNGSATRKTGTLVFRGDDTAGYDSVMMSLGTSGSNTALFHISHVNMPTTVPTVNIVPKASQTRGIFEIDGLNNDGTTAEARKWQLYPKGYLAVRESGNTTTDRAPSTGTSTATFTATNKPGSTTGVDPTMWFPMLSTAGALFWVPGWAD